MDPMDANLRATIERDGIRQCLERLARGEDRRDGGLISASYWPDAIADYGVFRGAFADYLAWVVPGDAAIVNTQHVLGQTYSEIAGDTARAETQVIAYHRVNTGAEERDTCIGGRYLDRLERRGGEWRIAERTMLYDWQQDWGGATDWAQGLMGLRFSHEWFSGRAHGDRSERFFAGEED
jgi:hypothetical protein